MFGSVHYDLISTTEVRDQHDAEIYLFPRLFWICMRMGQGFKQSGSSKNNHGNSIS